MNFSFWPFMIYLPIYFRSALGYGNLAAGLALLAYTLPTLVVPPLGERMLLRFQARIAIPLGLFVIGLGFMMMWAGSNAQPASWLTLLPGCLLAGIGLGLTNTPVTNTTTASVPSTRAGMASGIDMSARMISLAINIALMGFVLVEGISWRLKSTLGQQIDATQIQTLARRVAGGSTDLSGFPQLQALAIPAATLQDALLHGFGLVMLYGSLSVWILSYLSFLVCNPSLNLPVAKSRKRRILEGNVPRPP